MSDPAWQATARRVMAFLGRQAPPPPALEELLVAAAGVSPGPVLPFDLEEMTLRQWSGAFVVAVRDHGPAEPHFAPPWLAAASLQALGFWFREPRATDDWLRSEAVAGRRAPPAVSQAMSWSWRSAPGAERAVLIVCREQESIIAGWRPSTRSAALAVTPGQLEGLVAHKVLARPGFPAWPELQLLAIESTLDEWKEREDPKRWENVLPTLGIRPGSGNPGDRPPIVYFLAERPPGRIGPEYVIGPRSVEDLFPVGLAPQLAR